MNNRQLELLARIQLQNTQGIGPLGRKRILNHYKTALNFWKAGVQSWKSNNILNKPTIIKASQSELVTQIPTQHNFQLWGEHNYPQYLANCPDAPIFLFQKGEAVWSSHIPIGIVGTRKITSYGKAVLTELIQALSKFKVCIISGLAQGTDTLAHQLALEYDLPTVGVLAHGFSTLYPPENTGLAKDMQQKGALITEFQDHVLPIKEYFPLRNRIVAGMVHNLIVIESNLEGGSMITAKLSNSYGREVWAVPGPVNAPYSKGCNHLIGSQLAEILDDVSRYASYLELPDLSNSKAISKEFLSEEEEKILRLLEKGKLHIDNIQDQFSHPIHQNLLQLELDGHIKKRGSYYTLE